MAVRPLTRCGSEGTQPSLHHRCHGTWRHLRHTTALRFNTYCCGTKQAAICCMLAQLIICLLLVATALRAVPSASCTNKCHSACQAACCSSGQRPAARKLPSTTAVDCCCKPWACVHPAVSTPYCASPAAAPCCCCLDCSHPSCACSAT